MYMTVNELLNDNSNNLPDYESTVELANNFCDYFLGKVNMIRKELDANASASSNHNTNNYDSDIVCRLSQFQLVIEDTLHEVIMKCPSKSCSLDPMPTWLVKQHLPVLMPILTKIVNSSLLSGSFPSGLCRAIITSILKKASLDKNTLGNYCPVSNLPFVDKLTEKVVSVQVSDYGLSDPYQSAYTKAHSKETALACVQNDNLRAIDNQKAVFLLMLDFSAVFNTVDHTILLEQLAELLS